MSANLPEPRDGRPGSERTPRELAADIRESRRQLAATVDALATRADMRHRARAWLDRRCRGLSEAIVRLRIRRRESVRRTPHGSDRD